MDKKINILIKKYCDNESALNKLIVSAFVQAHHLTIKEGYLASFITKEQDELNEDLEYLSQRCSIEDIIHIFELAIPQSERTTNGAVYTPKYIRDYIVKQILHSTRQSLDECLCADISCGCGAFLYTLMEEIHQRTNLSYQSVIQHLYGLDISVVSIGRAKILLALAALQHGEIICENDFHLVCGDATTYHLKTIPAIASNNGFDIIVGNPPYVRSKNINIEAKKNLSLWETSKIGNADLYIPFFEIGMTLLNANGLLGYITVNTFFKSVNARSLRNYFSKNHFSLSIIDFGEQLVFKKKLAYTCLTFLSKMPTTSLLYTKADINDVKEQKNFVYSKINYDSLDNHKGWNLNRTDVLRNIQLIENAGESLGKRYTIKNGIATLANDVFIFRPTHEDGSFYYLLKDGTEYRIEKGICRNIIKPNILKTESEIPIKEEKIISPYDMDNNLITEDYFIQQYPNTYHYLLSYRHVLDARDKGEGDYGAWYAFGRTQAIADSGRKLLFPYMSDLPHFVYTSQKDMMIYCGYAIYNESENELLFLKRVLESSVFDYYMKNTSKPYATGYYSYAKNYVKNFGLYPFTEEQKQHILSLNTKEEVDQYIKTIYGIAI